MRTERAVDLTKSENITVTWRRSTRSSGERDYERIQTTGCPALPRPFSAAFKVHYPLKSIIDVEFASCMSNACASALGARKRTEQIRWLTLRCGLV